MDSKSSARTSHRTRLGDDNFLRVLNLSCVLNETGRYGEAKSFLLKQLPTARRTFGPEHWNYLDLRRNYANALFKDKEASRDDVLESISIYEDICPRERRTYGPDHPRTAATLRWVGDAREKLAALDDDDDASA